MVTSTPPAPAPAWAFWRRPPTVPVIRLAGLIGSLPLRGAGLTLAGLERAIERAFAMRRAPAVALAINSPGGSAVQSALIASRIRTLADRHRKPVLAFVEDVAASGGYWLATAADEILVDPASVLGSIGVISAGFGLDRAIERLGVERRVHTAGTRKSFLDPFRPEREEDLALLAELQGDIHERFKAQVRERRAGRLRAPEAELFDGRVWTGARAVAIGLADGLGELHTTLEERFGPGVRIRLVNPQRPRLLARLGLGTLAAEAVAEGLALLEERALRARLGL